jgi:Ca2+-binding RTX toxin-like protein
VKTKFLALALLFGISGPAIAVDDGHGREWRQLYETTGVSWDEVAAACPRDGVTPCAGTVGGHDLGTWVWATQDQVITFMSYTDQAILTADPPALFGPDYFFTGIAFLGVMRYTFYFATEVDYHESTAGLTATLDANGMAIVGSAAYGYYPISGGLGVASATDTTHADATVGIWLWRPIGPDYSPPSITPDVSGTAGTNGWYVSDVGVSFAVEDPDSAIISTDGCDPMTVSTDTFEQVFTCTAISEGGTASAAAFVKRDATRPTLTCVTPVPVFQLGTFGAQVSATVADVTSGPLVSPANAPANTNVAGTFTAAVTGTDQAGNTATKNCPYRVVIPKCLGMTPTIVGTGNPDNIVGTSGRDIIVGLGGSDTIDGAGGNDVICGNDGNDDLSGGDGNDILDGGPGNDSIRGDAGNDRCRSGEVRMSSCTPF